MKLVSEGIYRSARPTYKQLKICPVFVDGGFKTVINLEDDEEAIEQEEKWCRELQIIFYSFPLDEILPPKMIYINRIIDKIEQVRLPVLVHCKHGHERTGIVIAYYRMKEEGWSKWKAIKEALKEGFSPFYLWWFI
jgi:protein tyrosine/serine phosphatase